MSLDLALRRWSILILVALAIGTPPFANDAVAEAQTLKSSVRVKAIPSGGRIVFEWRQPVQANAATVGNRVVLIFNRPVKGSLAGISRGLPKVVRRVDVSADRRALTVVLHKPHAMRLVRRGRIVAVVLRRAGAKPRPTATAKARSKTKAKPAPVPAPAPKVAMDYAGLPALERVRFGWDAPVAYTVERVGGIVWLKFARPGRIDPAALRGIPRSAAISVRPHAGKSQLEVLVRAARIRAIRHRRTGNMVVLEVLRPKARWPAIAKLPPMVRKVEAKEKKKTEGSKKAEVRKPGPAMPPKARPAPRTPEKSAEGGSTADGGDTGGLPSTALAQVSLSKPGGISTLRFDWSRDVPAAIFRRGRSVWLVFGAPAELDLAPIRSGLKGEVTIFEQVKRPDVTVIRMVVGNKGGVTVGRDGSAWVISLTPKPGKTQQAIGIEAQPSAVGGGRVLLKAAGAMRPIVFKDPNVGDIIHLVPVIVPGFGVAAERRFLKFKLLRTLQGIVVEPVADGVSVRAGAASVTVSAAGGLQLSGLHKKSKAKKRAPQSTGRVFDFDRWRGGPVRDFPKEYTKQRQARQHAVAVAKKADRNARRMELAQFYFAHGHASDALGVLRSVERSDAVRARTAKFHALRGASRFLMGQLKSAGRDLYDKSLDNSFEAALWRGALSARAGRWKQANVAFRRSRQIVRHYPARLRARLGALGAEAAMMGGDLHRARGLLKMLRQDKLQPRELEALEYLDAAILAKAGQHKKAVAIWLRLAAEASDPRIRTRSKVARIEYELARGKLDAPAAIQELEKARYVWRGDDTEYRINELLGRVYLKAGNAPKGLEALDRARRLDPDLAKARKIKSLMQRHYTRLFLAGGADKMPPLRAMGVFHEFSHLMPSGPLGDKMIAALADRLVAVDLLGRAAALLAEQIDKRLTGVERARVGARLALLQLMDKKPAAAVAALRKSDMADMPVDLARQRRRLRARALANLGQTGNALILLGPDSGREAELLRADIHWKAGSWKEAAAAYGRIANKIPANAVALDDAQSRVVLAWAVTLALAGDRAGLKTLRGRFGRAMASGPYRATFQVIAQEVEAGIPDFRKIAAKVSEVDAYHAFMRVYRKRIAAGGLQAVN